MSIISSGETKLTYQDYLLFPDDGKRHELIDGDHYVSPAPTLYHQELLGKLHILVAGILATLGSGKVYLAPVDVQLSGVDVVQPDLLVVLPDRESILTPSHVVGAPHLAVEILSPSTRDKDLRLKRALYERSAVGEYWIVDPEGRQVILLSPSGGRLMETSRSSTGFHSPVLHVDIDLTGLW